jgi:hypothetical protein
MRRININNSAYTYTKTSGSLKQDLYKFDICYGFIFMVICIETYVHWVAYNGVILITMLWNI